MSDRGNTASNKLKVFVSYSRRDLEFADQIVAVLTWQGFLPSIDRKAIHGAENWKLRLGQLILESDVVVFVLSPDSATSEMCSWEVTEAVRRGKRIIPILCRPLEGVEPHEHLRALNYVHFYADNNTPHAGFGTGLVRFIDALSVDIDWLREHTRLEELAARWDGNHRDSDLLVRGSELLTFNQWRDKRPADGSDLTALQRAFLTASEVEEAARTNAEQQRLAEVDAAQVARQTAIEEWEAAVKRENTAQIARAKAQKLVTWGSITGALIVVVGALAFAALQQHNSKEQTMLRAEAERHTTIALAEKAVVDELIRRIRVGKTEAHGLSAMQKICAEAVSVTSTLASTLDQDEHANLNQRFWELYYGPMNLIEIRQRTEHYSGDSKDITVSDIETAMVRFGRKLKLKSQSASVAELPDSNLAKLSRAIELACDNYLS